MLSFNNNKLKISKIIIIKLKIFKIKKRLKATADLVSIHIFLEDFLMIPKEPVVAPYLFFNGNCREAMEFYKKALGGDLHIMTNAEAPVDIPDDKKNRIMHANLKLGNTVILAADSDRPLPEGDDSHLSITATSVDQAENFFENLSKGGKITMPLQSTFWAERFGMLKDKFGKNWMINLDKEH
jgi:PhnB protein